MNNYLILFFCLISGFVTAQEVPHSLPVTAKLIEQPTLLLTANEIKEINTKIKTQFWAKNAWQNITKAADNYIQQPFFFPESEGGWVHLYVDSISGAKLLFDKNSPRKHYSEDAKKYYQGVVFDRAWNSFAMEEVARRMEVLAIVSLVSGQKKYAQALKLLYLDAAKKYEKYRIHDRSFKVFGDAAGDIAGRAMSQSIDECNLLSKLALSYDGLVATNVLSASEKATIDEKLWGNANKLMHRILDRHPSGGNWWVWHSVGGLVVGLLTNDTSLIDKAINDPKTGILKMLRSDYLNEDGLASENSPGYQLFAMMAISRMALISKRIGMGFEKIPSVERSFYAMANFHYPDFIIPNMNDSRKQDIKTGGTLNSDMTLLDLLELGWRIYHSNAIMKNLASVYSSFNQDEIRSKGIFPLLYGPEKINDAIKGVSGSSNVSRASGIAMLRSANKDWTVLLKNTNPENGHAHPNSLHVAMFANGEEFIPSFGAPEYGHYSYKKWFVQTLAHNTVVVNTQNQNRRKVVNQIEWITRSGLVTAVRASTANIQDLSSDPGKALLMSRSLVMSPLAIYDFFNVSEDSQSKKKFSTELNTLDWVMHFNGNMDWDSGALSATTNKLVPDAVSGTTDQYPAYRLLTDLKKINIRDPLLQGILSQPLGGSVSVSLFPVQEETEEYAAFGLGYENVVNNRLPLILRRIKSNKTVIGGVYVPFKGENPVKKIDVLKQTVSSVVISMETDNGSEIVFQNMQNESIDAEDKQGQKFSFQGLTGTITSQKNKDKYYFLIGKSISDLTGTLSADKEIPVSLILSSQGPIVENLGDSEVVVTWKPINGSSKTFSLKPKGL